MPSSRSSWTTRQFAAARWTRAPGFRHGWGFISFFQQVRQCQASKCNIFDGTSGAAGCSAAARWPLHPGRTMHWPPATGFARVEPTAQRQPWTSSIPLTLDLKIAGRRHRGLRAAGAVQRQPENRSATCWSSPSWPPSVSTASPRWGRSPEQSAATRCPQWSRQRPSTNHGFHLGPLADAPCVAPSQADAPESAPTGGRRG